MKVKAMKVVFIITGLFTGGAEMVLFRILQGINRKQFSPHVISLSGKGDFGPRIEELNIPVTTMHMRPGRPNFSGFLRLVAVLRNLKPDVVQSIMYHANLLGGLATFLAGIRKLVWGIRSNRPSTYSTILIAKISSLLSYFLPQTIIVCAESAWNTHKKMGYSHHKMIVIHNGVDLDYFHPNKSSRLELLSYLGLPNNAMLVGCVSRFHPKDKNNIAFLLNAVNPVLEHNALAHFVLLGGGITKENLALQGAMNKLPSDKVHLLGRRNDIARIMPAFDVLASPSNTEAFPNVLIEAMACAVPCVVTAAGDSASIVSDTGRIVKIGDMKGLAKHIIDVLALPESRRLELGRRARKRVIDYYSIENMVQQHEQLYTDIYSSSRG